MPAGIVALVVVALLIFFGLAHRALDRLRLTDGQALAVLAAMVAGSFVDVPVLRGPVTVHVNLGGAVLPTLLSLYLLWRADTAAERVRSVVGAVLVAAAVLAVAGLTDFDPGRGDWLDPLWLFSGIGGIVGYLVGGRSRRASFVAGSMGLLLTDVVHSVRLVGSGAQATVLVGGAGAFDMVVMAGLLAVGLAEVGGELLERLSGGPAAGGPAGLALVVALSAAAGGAAATDERTDGRYFRLVDPARRVLTMTARVLVPGDVYIDRDNRRWVVQAVRGYEVLMRPSGTDGHSLLAPAAPLVAGAGQRPGGTVAIYFTHSDESYVPTSGKPWKPRGDVLQVGEALAAALRRQGVDATVSRRSHTPHDGQAYLRSRRTAVQLARLRPAMLVDVHRDAVPPQVYATRLKGRPAVRVRLVVGRQNPQMAANLEFARRVKAVADRELPGSIEGIFLAHGNYNQDLHPRALLLEFGAHSNSLPQAEATADLFAGVLARAAGIGPAGPAAGAGAARQLGAAAWRAVLALVVGTGGAALAYVAVNRPDLVRRWLRRLSRFTDPLQGR